MALNVYVVPAATGPLGQRTAKYFGAGQTYAQGTAGAPAGYVSMDYGQEPVFLVAARDVPAATHSALAALSDVTTVPDLAQTVGAQVAAVQAKLDSFNIPSQWVASGMSYGSVCRYVAVFFLIVQVLTQRLGRPRLFGGAVTLATRFNQLPASARQDLLDTAAALNFNTAALSGTNTVRQILKALADQWPAVSINVGEAVL
jgi:hypothetical protein